MSMRLVSKRWARASASTTTADNSGFTLLGDGDAFSYSIKLAEGVGLLSLVDKRSGDEVTVREGDYDIGEKGAVTVGTN